MLAVRPNPRWRGFRSLDIVDERADSGYSKAGTRRIERGVLFSNVSCCYTLSSTKSCRRTCTSCIRCEILERIFESSNEKVDRDLGQ